MTYRVLEITEETADELATFLREHGIQETYGHPLGVILAALSSEQPSASVTAMREAIRILTPYKDIAPSGVPQRACAVLAGTLEALGASKRRLL